MAVNHLEVIVEEPSMEAALRQLLPKLLGHISFEVYAHQGKAELLQQLPNRLRGYSHFIADDWRILVVVDRDDDDCATLKAQLEQAAMDVGFVTRATRENSKYVVLNRIAIEELEAWYFGDWPAVREIFPKLSNTIPQQARYRNPDGILGGTWEAFERVCQKAGYFKNGLRKIEAATTIASHMVPARNRSHSFQVLRNALVELVAEN
jgi:hypothetical protein